MLDSSEKALRRTALGEVLALPPAQVLQLNLEVPPVHTPAAAAASLSWPFAEILTERLPFCETPVGVASEAGNCPPRSQERNGRYRSGKRSLDVKREREFCETTVPIALCAFQVSPWCWACVMV
ncbi:UNVERIFIED_CONTAM: hypothetical protein K2H54_074590 [Gekko kuhli]